MKAHTCGVVTRFPSFPRAKTHRPRLRAALLATLLAAVAPQAYALQGVTDCFISISSQLDQRQHIFCGYPPYRVEVERGDNPQSHVAGRYEDKGQDANGATVNMTGGSVRWCQVTGGWSHVKGDANNNTVTISGGQVDTWVSGGNSRDGVANNNTVTISGGQVGDREWLNSGSVSGGDGHNGAAGNVVTISGGTVLRDVFGGLTDFGEATANSVIISGGTVQGHVYGGYTGYGETPNNGIVLASGSVAGHVIGGESRNGGSERSAGNILVVGSELLIDKAKNFSVGGQVRNFMVLVFTLPDDIADGDTMLKVGDSAIFTPLLPEAGKYNIGIEVIGSPALKVGDTITLIDAARGLTITPHATALTDGYGFEVKQDGNKLIATVTKTPASQGVNGFDGAGIDDDNSSPAMGELGLLLSGLALAGAAAPALRRREKQGKKTDTHR